MIGIETKDLKMKRRLTLKQKEQLIIDGKAYVSKCDGGYFLYIKDGSSQIIRKLSKKDFEHLDYLISK